MTLTVEEARAMPGAFRAYRRVDGELIWGEFMWVGEHFECDGWGDERTQMEEVVMVPVHVRTFPCHDEPEIEGDNE